MYAHSFHEKCTFRTILCLLQTHFIRFLLKTQMTTKMALKCTILNTPKNLCSFQLIFDTILYEFPLKYLLLTC